MNKWYHSIHKFYRVSHVSFGYSLPDIAYVSSRDEPWKDDWDCVRSVVLCKGYICQVITSGGSDVAVERVPSFYLEVTVLVLMIQIIRYRIMLQ